VESTAVPNRKELVTSLVIAAMSFVITGCSNPEPEGTAPNVILVMTDDQGYVSYGCYGHIPG